MDAAKIKHVFKDDSLLFPAEVDETGEQRRNVLKQKAIPMIVFNGFRYIADMPKYIFFLHQNFGGNLMMRNLWPAGKSTE